MSLLVVGRSKRKLCLLYSFCKLFQTFRKVMQNENRVKNNTRNYAPTVFHISKTNCEGPALLIMLYNVSTF